MSRCNADTETFTFNHRPLNWKNTCKTEIHRRTYLLRGGARHQTERNETKRNETTHVVEPRQELPASSRVGVVDTTILILGAAVGSDDTRAVEVEVGQVRQPHDARKIPRHALTLVEAEHGQVRQPPTPRRSQGLPSPRGNWRQAWSCSQRRGNLQGLPSSKRAAILINFHH
jgi:hypothetical protein